jgi:D-3-phosphoglycerate dehydrogenase / 2-oxoglutarate reductase
MNIVIPDDYQNCVTSLDCFAKLQGHTVTVYNGTVKSIDALVARFADADAIVLTRERTTITDELLARLPKLKLISQTGKVASHIDMEACAKRGITVMDGRGSGAATAELAMLLILASLRNLVTETTRLANGQWQGTLGRQLHGKTLGVLGFGRIGEQMCRLGAAFGAKPLVWGRESTLAKAMDAGYAVAASREAFFATSDIMTLQLRLTPETRHMVTSADLALMKPDTILVNTSRAELIETGALHTALKLGRPGFAAVDVYEEEPLGTGCNLSRNPLQDLPNCLCTPHLGFVEKDNYETYFGIAFDNINAFFRK